MPIDRIVCISDTHELRPGLIVPPCELLIHARDFTLYSKRLWMYRAFDVWLGERPPQDYGDYFRALERPLMLVMNRTPKTLL